MPLKIQLFLILTLYLFVFLVIKRCLLHLPITQHYAQKAVKNMFQNKFSHYKKYRKFQFNIG